MEKKIVIVSTDNNAGFIIIGCIEASPKLGGGLRLVTRGDVEIRIVFNLAQAEAVLREYESEAVPEQAVAAYQQVAEMSWAYRQESPPAVRISGEAARFLCLQLLTALFDPNVRATFATSDGEWARLTATNRPPQVVPVDPKGNSDIN